MKSSTGRFYSVIALMIFSGLLLSTNIAAQTLIQNDINGPAGSGEFGKHIAVLPNGNFVVTDPEFSIAGGAQSVGAVYLYSRQGNLISTLTGSTAFDRVGSDRVIVLANGNFVIHSPQLDRGTIVDVGAVTFGRMTTGVSGVVSNANSLVGSKAGDSLSQSVTPLPNSNYIVQSERWDNASIRDAGAVTLGRGNVGISGVISPSNSIVGSIQDGQIGEKITILSNGNYVIRSPDWNDYRGAATFGTATIPLIGVVSSVNSLVGSTGGDFSTGDRVGENITALSNGNYVVHGGSWDNGIETDAGFATFGNGSTGVSGEVSIGNSIVGAAGGNSVGSSVTPLTNGNYVVQSTAWDNGSTINVGAVTFCGNPNGCAGSVSSSNSLIGSTEYDNVGMTVSPLVNGNYVVMSPSWDNGSTNVGAVTFGNGNTGISGTVSTANSLVGSQDSDSVGGNDVFALATGNYVVVSPFWDSGTLQNAGAVSFGDGNTGLTGVVSDSNSLIGATALDQIGSRSVVPLANGNYIVSSPMWDDGAITNAGAVTFGSGTTGVTGSVSVSNSLIGSNAEDQVGSANDLNRPMPNGDYLVLNSLWNSGAGAVTLGNGTTGTTGIVSSANSIIGSAVNDRVGGRAAVLSNGNYVLSTTEWDNGTTTDVGAITFAEGASGITGVVSTSNSVVGNQPEDLSASLVTELANGYYVVLTGPGGEDFGNIGTAGAVFFSNTSVTGQINSNNSILGSVAGDITTNTSYSFDESINRLYVGRPLLNKVTAAVLSTDQTQRTKFDFDGDGKSDVSIFRPGPGEWWYLRSSDLVGRGFQFGSSTDKPVPADFTGDGKTDIAFWRNGEWFVLRSEDSSFYSVPFGTSGDIPAPGDFDGDGMADTAVYRPSNQFWYIQKSSGGTTFQQFGAAEDKPTVADFDGDGKDDIAVFRPSLSQWWQLRSTAGVIGYQFGATGDKTVQGDFTGDGKADVALFRPSDSNWYVLRSEDSSFYSVPFGLGTDIPVAGDYDGDGKFDTAVFRPSDNNWYVQGSTSGFFQIGFGITGDVPLPSVYAAP